MVLKHGISQFVGIIHQGWRDYSCQLVFLALDVKSHSRFFKTPKNKRNSEPHQQNVPKAHQEKEVDNCSSITSSSHAVEKDCLPLIAHKSLEDNDSSIQNVVKVSPWTVYPFELAQICELGNRLVVFIEVESSCKHFQSEQSEHIYEYHNWYEIVPYLC